jgi:hypothetical protein
VHVGQTRETRVYELRTYTANPGKLPALEKRFAEHALRPFEKHGMRNEMYWVPTDGALRSNTLIYVISHESREAADRNWKAFSADTTWQRVRAASEVTRGAAGLRRSPVPRRGDDRVQPTRHTGGRRVRSRSTGVCASCRRWGTRMQDRWRSSLRGYAMPPPIRCTDSGLTTCRC